LGEEVMVVLEERGRAKGTVVVGGEADSDKAV